MTVVLVYECEATWTQTLVAAPCVLAFMTTQSALTFIHVCNTTSTHAIQYNAIQRNTLHCVATHCKVPVVAMQRNATQRNAMQRLTALRYVAFHCFALCCVAIAGTLTVCRVNRLKAIVTRTLTVLPEARTDNDRSRWIAPVFQSLWSDLKLYALERSNGNKNTI